MIVLFGKKKVIAGSFEVFMYECPFCDKINTTTIIIYTWYIHVFLIPFFPFRKEAYAICTDCKTKRNELKFGPKLLEELKSSKIKIRHPWWTWGWTIVFLILVLSIVILAPK